MKAEKQVTKRYDFRLPSWLVPERLFVWLLKRSGAKHSVRRGPHGERVDAYEKHWNVEEHIAGEHDGE